jgi:hypothetical protein
MPEWKNLTWDQSTWGDPPSVQTQVLQETLGGHMPWSETQYQTGERRSFIRVYALDDATSRKPIVEIIGIDPSSSLSKQIRDGIVEEQKLSLSISDPTLAEYYLHGAGRSYLQEFSYIKVEQTIKTASNEVVLPIGIFRISSIPHSSDDGSGVAITWEAEDWLASVLRTPFADGENPYATLVSYVEGSIDVNSLPPGNVFGFEILPQGMSPERLAQGNAIFSEESHWYHNFFGYIWHFMMNITNEHFIVDRSVINAAKSASKIKVASPALLGLEMPSARGLLSEGPGESSSNGSGGGSIAGMMEYGSRGTPEEKFGILAFPEGPSRISYLKDIMTHDGTLSSHSGVRGTYFIYDANGELHWRSWGEIDESGLSFICGGDAKGKISLPVERIETSISEPQYNHFVVEGVGIGFTKTGGYTNTIDGLIPVEVLRPPEGSGLGVYGELHGGFTWSEASTLSKPFTPFIEVPPGGLDYTFPFMENYGGEAGGGTRPFNPAFTVAPDGSEIGAAFYGNTMADPLETGADSLGQLPVIEVSRNNSGATYHFDNETDVSYYIIGWSLIGTVWAPTSLWDEPDQADFTDEIKWDSAVQHYDSTQPSNLSVNGNFNSSWYTYPGLRDRSLHIYMGEDHDYLVMPVNIIEQPPDPRVLRAEYLTLFQQRLESAYKYFCGSAFQLTLSLDSALGLGELGKSIRVQYPPEGINGHFQLMSVNMPFDQQAQSWTLQWLEDA